MTVPRQGVVPADGAELLLVNPPLGPLLEPYISIPVLAGYLRKRGLRVSAFDANRAFVMSLLTSRALEAGIHHVQTQFLKLNGQPQLTYSECVDYYRLLGVLDELSVNGREIEWLRTPFTNQLDFKTSPALKAALRLAFDSFHPEITLDEALTPRLGRHRSNSPADILAGCDDQSPWARRLRNITADLLEGPRPRVIGLSIVFDDQVIPAFLMASLIKRIAPEIHITVGGPKVSIDFRLFATPELFANIDSAVLDEGELPLEHLVRELSGPSPDLSRVPGLVYLDGTNVRSNPSVPPVDMEMTLLPTYEVFDLDQYPRAAEDLILSYRLSRGCSWGRCSFCRTELYAIKHFQQPPFEAVYEHLRQLIDRTGCHNFLFSDDSADPLLLEYLSRRLIEGEIEIRWKTHTRVSRHLTRERCRLFKRAGCIALYLGVESFSGRILRLMKKGITVPMVEAVLGQIGGEVRVRAYMIVGFPTETEEEAVESYEKVNAFQRRGLLESAFYSLFGIIRDSEIGRCPEKFSIRSVDCPQGHAMRATTAHFEGQGMSRQKAHELFLRFSGAAAEAERLARNSRKLQVDGVGVAPAFDPAEVFRNVSACWETMFLSEVESRDLGDMRVAPLRRDPGEVS